MHINSVTDILPKCGNILKLVCVVLILYASLGMQIFKHVRADGTVDNYNLGFNDFITALLTLVRVSVSESWFSVVSAFSRGSSGHYECHHISSDEQAERYAQLGCGSWLAYPYFLSFHIVMVLLILNLLIATMASAYDDNYEI